MLVGGVLLSWLTHGRGVVRDDTKRNISVPKTLTVPLQVRAAYNAEKIFVNYRWPAGRPMRMLEAARELTLEVIVRIMFGVGPAGEDPAEVTRLGAPFDDLLMLAWSEDEETVCIHPTGVRLVGNLAIRESWRSIFANASLRVQAEHVVHWQGTVFAIHHLTEVLFVGDDPNPHGPLHVTHIYTRGAHGWRLVSRHASAADDGHQAMADAIPHTLH